MHGAGALASPVAATPGRRGVDANRAALSPGPAAPPFATHSSLPSPGPPLSRASHPQPSPARADAPAAGIPSHRTPFVAPLPHDASSPPLVLGAAAAEDANPRFRPTMEDCYSIHLETQDSFFGVFDGHGGASVAQCVALAPTQ